MTSDDIIKKNFEALMEEAIPPNWDSLDLEQILFDSLKESHPQFSDLIDRAVSKNDDQRFKEFQKFSNKHRWDFNKAALDVYTKYHFFMDRMIAQLLWKYPSIAERDEIHSMAHERLMNLVSKEKQAKEYSFAWNKNVIAIKVDEASGIEIEEEVRGNSSLLYLETKFQAREDDLQVLKDAKKKLDSFRKELDRVFKFLKGEVTEKLSVRRQIELAEAIKYTEKEIIYLKSLDYIRDNSQTLLSSESSLYKPDAGILGASEGLPTRFEDLDDNEITKLKTLTLKDFEQEILSFNMSHQSNRNISKRVLYKPEAKAAFESFQDFMKKNANKSA